MRRQNIIPFRFQLHYISRNIIDLIFMIDTGSVCLPCYFIMYPSWSLSCCERQLVYLHVCWICVRIDYRLNRTSFVCHWQGCGPTTYVSFNASDVNAVQVPGVSGFSNCYTACINNKACTGFDLRNNDCYWSTTALANTAVNTNASHIHVEISHRTPCGSK